MLDDWVDFAAWGAIAFLVLLLVGLCWNAYEREPGPCVDGMRDTCLDVLLCLREVKEPCGE